MTTRPLLQARLSPKQVVFLFVATVVVGVVVFLCGVLVGRGVPLAHLLTGATGEARASAIDANEPSAVISTPRREPATLALAEANLTYYRRLNGASPAATDRIDAAPAASKQPIAPANGPAPTRPIITPARDSGYTLQVSVLRDRNAAEQLAKRLTEKGYPAFVAIPFDGAPIAMFTVRVGPYADRPDAERAFERLKHGEAFNPRITR